MANNEEFEYIYNHWPHRCYNLQIKYNWWKSRWSYFSPLFVMWICRWVNPQRTSLIHCFTSLMSGLYHYQHKIPVHVAYPFEFIEQFKLETFHKSSLCLWWQITRELSIQTGDTRSILCYNEVLKVTGLLMIRTSGFSGPCIHSSAHKQTLCMKTCEFANFVKLGKIALYINFFY